MKSYEELYEDGRFILDERYTEIVRLDNMLTEANIPHEKHRFLDGWQVVYFVGGKRIADAVQHFGSYGNEKNLIEIMGLVDPEETMDSVLGHLTAENVFDRISKHYKESGAE